jgi:hypothetical protein
MKPTEFYPLEWSGKSIADQRELFDQILTYYVQSELHKIYARKITHKEWVKKGAKAMNHFAHQWAYDLFQKILDFYKVTELNCDIQDSIYVYNETIIHRTYAMYDDYFERARYSVWSKYYMVYVYISAFTAY